MNVLKKLYNKCLVFLSNHSKIAFILSHGGIHLVGLILLFIFIIILYGKTDRNEEASIEHIQLKVSITVTGSGGNEIPSYYITSIRGDISLNDKNYYDGSVCFSLLRCDYLFEDYFDRCNGPFYDNYALGCVELSTMNCEKEDFYDILVKHDTSNIDYEYYYHEEPNNNSFIAKRYIFKDSVINWALCPEFKIKRNHSSVKTPTSVVFFEIISDNNDLVSRNIQDLITNDLVEENESDLNTLKFSFGYTNIEYDNTHYNPIEIKYIYPEPDKVTPSSIEYNGVKSIHRILANGGVCLIYDDIIARNKANRVSLQYSVLIGAIITFMLDIIVNLILKWRRLSKPRIKSVKKHTIKRKRR